MNETGLAIGMAAVPTGYVPADPEKETISSLGVMREVLDHAATVEEAVAIIRSYNIDFSGGPDLHYLIADKTGASALVEFSDGEVVVIENEQPWHMMTNFIVDQHRENPEGQCVRYRAISDKLEEQSGVLTVEDALKLLWQVSQSGSTQWSVVYDLSRVEVNVVMGMEYEEVFRYPVINP
jgi:predicted choloylglycine hydrolase